MEALYTTSRQLAGEQISVPGYVHWCLSLAKPESDLSSQQKCALLIHGYTRGWRNVDFGYTVTKNISTKVGYPLPYCPPK